MKKQVKIIAAESSEVDGPEPKKSLPSHSNDTQVAPLNPMNGHHHG
jgi:hypothetical protein